eukprot:Nitzschia sp. Nitz4//scaffold87_size112219//89740//90633//NITZ4_004086-RA/size112219-processed-gene-0.113-mRNA-1//1//CDS//3329559405//6746//frame0
MAPQSDDVTTVSTGSYWDAPPEKQLEGKTLSTMDMQLMTTSADPSEDRGSENSDLSDTTPAASLPRNQSSGSYWGWQEDIKKTLSNLSLSDMFAQHTHVREAPVPEIKVETPNNTNPKGSGFFGGGYWFWRNPSMTNLGSTASLNTMEQTARESDRMEGATGASPAGSTGNSTSQSAQISKSPSQNASGGGYWFWRNASMQNMSNASLDTMEQTARETDRMEGVGTGPISNLQHKLRSTWRRSFQQLSNNSLSRLDEKQSHSLRKGDLDALQHEDLDTPHEEEDEDSDAEEEGAISF